MNNLVFLINLHQRKERLNHTLNELKTVNLSNTVIRIEGCDSKKAEMLKHEYSCIDVYNNKEVKLKSLNIIPTWSSLGCAISHVQCWKSILDMNIDYALICEDDLHIIDKNKFLYNYNYGNNFLKNNINKSDNPIFISLDGKCKDKHLIKDNIYSIHGPFIGTACYIINKYMAKLLLNIIPFKYQ